MVKLSLVIPVYNEEDIIKNNAQKIIAFLDANNIDFEILFGNDGSTDDTANIIEKIQEKDKRIKLFNYPKNEGRGSVLKKTFPHGKGEIIAYMDADREISEKYIPSFMDTLEDADVAVGSKFTKGRRSRRSLRRDFASLLYNFLVRFFLKSNLMDHQGGMKAFRRGVLFDILPDVMDNGWVWDTEILIRAQAKGYKIVEIPVITTPYRKSKVNLGHDAIKMAKGVLNLYRNNVIVKK